MNTRVQAPQLRFTAALVFLIFPLLFHMGCSEKPAVEPVDTANPVAGELSRMGGNFAQGDPALLRQLVQATARYHSTVQATRAGYEATPCVEVPGLGGMGEHWVNESLVDPVFDVTRPEALLYEPQPNGQRKLVAVEYIVIDVGQPRPSFGNREFDLNGTPVPVPHWSLHVWVWKDNPNGLFTPFNPNVRCP